MLGVTFGNLWNLIFRLWTTFGKDLELLGDIWMTFSDSWGLLVRIGKQNWKPFGNFWEVTGTFGVSVTFGKDFEGGPQLPNS